MAKSAVEYLLGVKKGQEDSPIEIVAQVELVVDGERTLQDVTLAASDNPGAEAINMGIITPEQYYLCCEGMRKGTSRPSPNLAAGEEFYRAEVELRREGVKRSSNILHRLIEGAFGNFDTMDDMVQAAIDVCQKMDDAGVEAYKSPFFDAAMMVFAQGGDIATVVRWVEMFGQDEATKDLSGKKSDVELLADSMMAGEPVALIMEGDDNTVVINLDTGDVTPDDEERIRQVKEMLKEKGA